MNDIFISYDSVDRPTAHRFADAFRACGWTVWWDRDIPLGQDYDHVIEREINAARCVVVLWSKQSVTSRWVKTEAAAAADRDRLIPVLIEETPIPFEFRRIQTADLISWRGDAADAEFRRLARAVEHMLALAPARAAVPVPEIPSRKPMAPSADRRRLLATAAAAFLIVLAGVVALMSSWQRGDRPAQAPVNVEAAKTRQDPSSPTAQVSEAAKSPASHRAFTIKVGDRIADGIPAPGADAIETPLTQNLYRFEAAPRQQVYFRMLRHSAGMSYIRWRLTDADGMEIFNTCLACGEPGVHTLTKGGRYLLTVGSDTDKATGTYQLQLFSVPAPDQFSIKVGDTIRENVPGPGAGVIESPGAHDIYSFTASPRQRIYFRKWEHGTGMSYIKWKLTDDNGMEIFNACLGCGEPGVQTLSRGGTYTLSVGNERDPSSGTYRLQLYPVPSPDRFSIKIGDRIRPGVPGAGAATIESPGAEDIYVFSAASGQKVDFRVLERDNGMDYIRWRLIDDNGTELFNTCLGCGQPGVRTLSKGGTYTLIVGNMTHPATGSYALEIAAR